MNFTTIATRTALGALAIVALLAAIAHAEEPTRDSYREAVEPICKVNTQANERILSGVKQAVRKNKLKQASRQFSKAAAALRKTLAELKAVPQPIADEARLAKWLADVGDEASLLEAAAKKLKAGNKAGAQTIVVRLTHNANLTNSLVAIFEFKFCRFEPSRFT